MKRTSMDRLRVLALSVVGVSACNVDVAEMQKQYEAQMQEQQSERENAADENLASIELTDPDAQAAQKATLTDEEKARIEKIESLLKEMGKQVNECSGIDQEVTAFHDRVEQLRSEGKTHEEIKVALADEHAALKQKLEEGRQAFRACREEAKTSDLGKQVQAVVEACFTAPDRQLEEPNMDREKRRGHGPRGKGGKGMPFGEHGERGEGRMHREKVQPKPEGVRLPPFEFQKLSDPACIELVDQI